MMETKNATYGNSGINWKYDQYVFGGRNIYVAYIFRVCCKDGEKSIVPYGYIVTDDWSELDKALRLEGMAAANVFGVAKDMIIAASGLYGGMGAASVIDDVGLGSFKWGGAKISGSREGIAEGVKVTKLMRLMLEGKFDYASKAGRIGGYLNSNGEYIITEGHHRMVSAMEIFKKTGNSRFVDELLKYGRWTKGAGPEAKPLPPIK